MANLFESDYLYGFHDPGGERYMIEAGKPGWIVFTEGIGRDPNNRSGFDYRPYSNQGLGIITRLNHGYYPEGTIPNSRDYADFAKRCANFVANSPGCKIWIIGNEMNYRIERPAALNAAVASAGVGAATAPSATSGWNQLLARVGRLFGGGASPAAADTSAAAADVTARLVITAPTDDPYLQGLPQRFSAIKDEGQVNGMAAAAAAAEEIITPELYVRCYRLCRDAIHAVPGHADDQVLIGAVAPWNNQTTYAGNTLGDWVKYFQDILTLLGPTGCDGITLHTYTHQADPNLITSSIKMNPPFQNRHFEFRTYMDFMAAIPVTMRSLPVYITETNQDVVWVDRNTNWVQRAYGEIDWWNRQAGNQKIRALVLYRYPPIDRWVIEGKGGVIQDFKLAMQNDYRWRQSATPPTFAPGASVATNDVVNLRRTAGYVGKPANDVLMQLPRDTTLTLVSGPQTLDGLAWWQVRTVGSQQPGATGWVARTSPTGVELLRLVTATTPPDEIITGDFKAGDTLQTADVTRLRRTAGYVNKPATDVVTDLPAATRLTVVSGPSRVDNLTWWQVRTTSNQSGWAAQTAPNGQVLLTKVAVVNPPPTGAFKAGDRVVTQAVVRMRQSPGYLNKPATDVVADIAAGVQGTVLSGPQSANNLTWWRIQTTNPAGAQVTGWMAEKGPDGQTLLAKAGSTGGPVPTPGMAAGDIVTASSPVRVRRSAGITGKAADDVLGELGQKASVKLISGPRTVDSLQWWQVGGIGTTGQELVGWSADRAPNGAALLALPTVLPGTNIPNKVTGAYLGAPFRGSFGISQLWGENPQIYGQITYDGVRLLGHNGIDFLTPVGTPILAVEGGVVEETIYNDPSGFGNYIKVRHDWGESVYAHLNTIDVQTGRRVARGDALGTTGNTGFSNGPHLHFAIRINPYRRTDGWGGFSDPLPYLLPSVIILPSYVTGSTAAARTAAAGAPATYRPLAEAPGYAPDKPGVVRP